MASPAPVSNWDLSLTMPVPMIKRLTTGIFAALLVLTGLQAFPANAAPDDASPPGDVTVKHNPDGSIEVFDVPEKPVVVPNRARRAHKEKSAAEPAQLGAPLAAKFDDPHASASAPPVDAAAPEQAADNTAPAEGDGLFAVKPVVSTRKVPKTPGHRNWSHGISAL